MKHKSLFIRGLLGIALVFVMVFAGCDNNTTTGGGGDPEKPDITELNAEITKAEAAKDGVVTATQASDVASGRKWVTAPVMENFEAAIERAKAARNAATQTEVNLAKIAISAATAAFQEVIGIGTKTSGFTQQELAALINEANTAKTGVRVSADGADVPSSEFWVTQSVMTALTNAISSAQSAQAANLDNAYTALNTALIAFYAAKKPGNPPRKITINGLNYPNGTGIQLGVFPTAQINTTQQPDISGGGTIQNNTVTITLYTSNNALWSGNGSYYVGFMVNTEDSEMFISKSQVTFSDAAPNQTLAFTAFKPYVFRYTLGEFAEEMEITIPPEGITLDEWINQVSQGYIISWADALESGFAPMIYKDEACTQPFSGTDTLTATTPIYSKAPINSGSRPSEDDSDERSQIGTITGTITLTDVPNPAPQVRIQVEGGDYDGWWYGDSRLTISGSGTVSNISWSIPIYGDDGFSASEGRFILWVGNNNGFRVNIPTTPQINSANESGISLGTVSIRSITLSGTINVTCNGQPVPYVRIGAIDSSDWSWNYLGSTDLRSPSANAAWSITVAAITSDNIIFNLKGYPNSQMNWKDLLFDEQLETPVVSVSGANVSNINLNAGDITP